MRTTDSTDVKGAVGFPRGLRALHFAWRRRSREDAAEMVRVSARDVEKDRCYALAVMNLAATTRHGVAAQPL